jgi:hypothetical protein
MTKKPRKLKRLEGYIIDAGEFGDPAPPAESVENATEEASRQGRPLGSTSINYTEMDWLISFYRGNEGALSQKTLIDLIRHIYVQKYGSPPGKTTIRDRLSIT